MYLFTVQLTFGYSTFEKSFVGKFVKKDDPFVKTLRFF